MKDIFDMPAGASTSANTSNNQNDESEAQNDSMQIHEMEDSEMPVYAEGDILPIDRNENSIDLNKTLEISLETKLRKIFDRYRLIKQRPLQFNKPNAQLKTENLPATLKNLILNNKTSIFGQPLNANKVFVTKSNNNWSNLNRDEKIGRFTLMSYLKSIKQKALDINTSTSTVDISHGEQTAVENQSDHTPHTSYLIDSQLSMPIYWDKESKYASQLVTRNEPKMNIESTTTLSMSMACSTPHKSMIANLRPPIDSPIFKSPIVKPFEKPSDIKEPKLSRERVQYVLNYLGLKSIDDLFLDVEEEQEENVKVPSQQRIEAMNQNKDNLAIESDSIIESQLLKICEHFDADKKNENDEIINVSPITKTIRLNVGNVNDLFRDSDDSDDELMAKLEIDTTGEIECSQESDCTVDYDVNDVIQKNNITTLKSLTASKSFNDREASTSKSSNVGSAKPVRQSISDDLFSTYNESTINHHNEKSVNFSKNIIPTTPSRSTNQLGDECDRSPSVLYKPSSVLARSNRGTQSYMQSLTNKPETPFKDTKPSGSNDDDFEKSPNLNLSKHLDILNSQISFHSDFDDFKENIASPFATCRSTKQNQNKKINCDKFNNSISLLDVDDADDDDVFSTCQILVVRQIFIEY